MNLSLQWYTNGNYITIQGRICSCNWKLIALTEYMAVSTYFGLNGMMLESACVELLVEATHA